MTSHTQHCTSVSCKGCVLILHRALQTSIRMLHQCIVINGYVKNTTTTGYFLFVLGVSFDYRSENIQRNQMFKTTRTVHSKHHLYFFIFDLWFFSHFFPFMVNSAVNPLFVQANLSISTHPVHSITTFRVSSVFFVFFKSTASKDTCIGHIPQILPFIAKDPAMPSLNLMSRTVDTDTQISQVITKQTLIEWQYAGRWTVKEDKKKKTVLDRSINIKVVVLNCKYCAQSFEPYDLGNVSLLPKCAICLHTIRTC